MKTKLFIFFLLLGILRIESSSALEAFAFPLNGSATLSTKQININKYSSLYQEGNTFSLKSILMGKMISSDFTGLININKDKDSLNVENLFLEMPYQDTKMEIGDFYLRYTSFGLDNLKIRGINLEHSLIKDKASLFSSYGLSQEKREALSEDVNQNNLIDYGEDKNQNGQLDSYDGIFAQFITATRINLKMFKNTNLNLNYFKIQDKASSIANPKEVYPYSIVTPIGNNHLSLDGDISLYGKGKYLHRLLFEYNRSYFDLDTKDVQEYKADDAYQITLANKISKTNFNLTYFHIKPDYKTAGNLFLLSNQRGFKLHTLFSAKSISLNMDNESYQDNLDKINNLLTTKTNIFKSNLNLTLSSWPKLSFGHKLSRKKSNFLSSLSPSKISKKEETFSFGVTQNFEDLGYFVNTQLSNYLNNSLYKSEYKPAPCQNITLNLNLNTYPKKKGFSTSSYLAYNRFTNKGTGDCDESGQVNLGASYYLIPAKLIFSPEYKITIRFFNKELRSKNQVLGWQGKYYFSINKVFSLSYKNIRQEDPENERECFKSHLFELETTLVF
ncbi:MAG: hypothetical protein ABIG09_02255 [bacterium]